MSAHPHAELMKLYAEDAAETETPWERWEVLHTPGWCFLAANPHWDIDRKYRRKPRTIRIGEFDVPGPYRTQLQEGQTYYYPVPTSLNLIGERRWCGATFDKRLLSGGLVHLTREAAETHAKALISLTETLKWRKTITI